MEKEEDEQTQTQEASQENKISEEKIIINERRKIS